MGILTVTATTAAVLSTDTIITLSVAGTAAIGAAVYGAVDWIFFQVQAQHHQSIQRLEKSLKSAFKTIKKTPNLLKKNI